jgi:ribosome-binding factor A
MTNLNNSLSLEEAEIRNLKEQRDALADRVAKLSTRAHYADCYAEALEMQNEALEEKVEALEEANDALRSLVPTYQDRVSAWIRGERVAL